MSEDKYSVIMTAFKGDLHGLYDAMPEIFGRRGLDLFSLFMFDGFPSELVADLSLDEAIRIGCALEAFGPKVDVTPTTEVEGMLHRADELWPMCYGERYDFLEIDGMIFSAPALNARQNLKSSQERSGKCRDWTYELSINHSHVDSNPDRYGSCRETIREGNSRIVLLTQDLQACYPSVRFVISHHLGSVVSFYQAAEDAPKETIRAKDRSPAKAWCTTCDDMQPYHKRTEPDAEFPEADWGDCAVCGDEVLVAASEVLILIGPEES